MQPITIDITKLKTINNYAKSKGITPAAVYAQLKVGKDGLKCVIIDGMKFIKLP